MTILTSSYELLWSVIPLFPLIQDIKKLGVINNQKAPFYFILKDIEIFGIAGIFNIHIDSKGNHFKSFSIITTSANSLVGKIHNRMPVILKKEKYLSWLNEIKFDLLEKNFIPFDSNTEVFPSQNIFFVKH